MKRRWVELICDHCGNADYYPPGPTDAMARANGWIITKDGRHYDGKQCYAATKAEEQHAAEAPHEA